MFKKASLILIATLLITMLFGEIPELLPFRLILTLWPLGHIVVFAFFSSLALKKIPYVRRANFKRQFLLLSLSCFIIGTCIELLQPLFYRSAEVEDLFYNYLGTLLALFYLGNFTPSQPIKMALRASYAFVLITLLTPTILTAYDEYRLRKDLPVIANYYNQTALTRWKADGPISIINIDTLPEGYKGRNHNILQARFESRKASRVVLRYFEENWQTGDVNENAAYQQLQFDFFNPNQTTVPLRIIMTDKHYGKKHATRAYRFGRTVLLPPGWSTHQISLIDIQQNPTARDIDLTQMAGIDFYMYKLKEPITLFIDEIKLIP
ncbi:hypothetical protein CW745_15040 [Psychromonas sp. psych-6C06]|uniref:VanZ family protein n=1 Tax=Psychromonas sp. psych-6C06 TaxID=2058089 RepID=UPI000C34E1D6|nr:VanZ family protein [Psychromonas sp. psych-6C06]PKF60381.1 hypothetical protein CW745_15040 [Psychromonas sp. psych-6C06]